MPLSPELPNVLEDIAQVVVYGNSIPAGGGASASDRDIMTVFAQMIKAKEYNYAKAASRLHFANDVVNGRWGVWPTVFQSHKRPVRAASTIATVDPAIGATSLTLAHSNTSATGVAFKAGDIIHVGTGDTAGTGGEIIVASADQSGTTLGLKAPVGWEGGSTGLLRDHAIGDPVYVVPTQYKAGNTIYFVCEAHNFTAGCSPAISPASTWYQNAMRAIVARLRCAEVYEADHSGALKFTGTWSANAGSPSNSSGVGNQGIKQATAVNAAVELHLPDNFPGGTAVICFIAGAASNGTGVWTFTVDGSAAGTLTAPVPPAIPSTQAQTYVQRFTGLAPGRHKIIAQLTTLGTGPHYFDWAGIEAPEPPLIVWFKPHRLFSYQFFGSGWDYGHIPTTLAAQANAGATSISVNQAAASFRQIATTPVPKAGETITIEPGTANEETRTVTTISGAGPFTINFSGGALAFTHASGSVVHGGIKDSDLPTVSGWIDSVAAEFDKLIVFDPDRVIQKTRGYFFQGDYAHWSDEGHQRAAQALFDQLVGDPRLASSVNSKQSRPLGLPTSSVSFLAVSTAFSWAVPLAVTEFGGAVSWRRQVDLSRAFEARLCVNQPAAGTAGARLRLQYSLDGGTTWFYLHRKLNALAAGDSMMSTEWSEPTAAADLTSQIDAGSGTGLKAAIWQPIYPDALTDVQLRVVGIGGGAGASTWMGVWMEYR